MRRSTPVVWMFLCAALAGAMLGGAQQAPARERYENSNRGNREREGQPVSYYALSLSWSPSFCKSASRGDNSEQCGGPRPFGFVVHGLWPQWDRGWPENCTSSEPGRVPERIVESMLDLMPARALIQHEWRTHGTCSGLDQAGYFHAVRAAREAIRIPERFVAPTDYQTIDPEDLRAAFVAANPGLRPEMMALACRGRDLREVRICLDTRLSPRPCGANEGPRQCRSRSVVLPPVR